MELTLKYNKKKAYFNVLQIAFIAPFDEDGTVIYLTGDDEGVSVNEEYDAVKQTFKYELECLYGNRTVRMNKSGNMTEKKLTENRLLEMFVDYVMTFHWEEFQKWVEIDYTHKELMEACRNYIVNRGE